MVICTATMSRDMCVGNTSSVFVCIIIAARGFVWWCIAISIIAKPIILSFKKYGSCNIEMCISFDCIFILRCSVAVYEWLQLC